MLVSNDFSMRMMGHLIPQVPGDKSEVYDHTFESIMKKIGQHQVFIDISRCSKLTTLPFRCFQSCKALLYVDVSYTKLNDLRSLCDHLYDLRALNVSGLEVMDSFYHPIAKLPSLEVLAIRNCNISNIDFIESLSCLRSLDLGSNTVTTDPILHIRNLTRIQELVLDSTKFPIETWGEPVFTWANIDVFDHLSSLKLLNISETALERFLEQIQQRIGRNLLIEAESRRWLLFSAIANNDYHTVYRLITSGCDVNARVHIEDELAMSKLWRRRCTTPKLRAPFFQCSGVEHSLRPNLLHFAIYFNSLECIQILLDCGADVNLPVWFADIREVEGKLMENTTLAQKQTRKVVSARQLVDAAYQRNVHRLTADMIAKKVSGWKAIVTVWYKRLLYVFGAPRGGSWLSAEEIDAKMQSAYIADSSAAAAEKDAGMEGVTSEGVVPVADTTAIATAAEDALGDALQVSPAEPPAAPASNSTPSTIASSTPALVVEMDQPECDTVLASSPSAKTPGNGFRKDRIIPPKQRLFSWREHSIVAKILGKPLMLEVKVPISDPISMNPSIALTKGKKASMRGRESIRLLPAAGSVSRKTSLHNSTGAGIVGVSSPSTKQYGSIGGSMSSFGSTTGWLGAPETEPVKDFEIVTLPLLGKESYWLESRSLVVQERERIYEQALLPVLGRKPLDAVERMMLDAAKLRPKPAQDIEKEAELQRLAAEERALQVQVSEESESVSTSCLGTPDGTPGSLTPFLLSPPGTAGSPPPQRRASIGRESLLRESFSRGGKLPLPASEERGLDSTSASTKRLSSSERRDRFFQQLSQRMEDRYLPDS